MTKYNVIEKFYSIDGEGPTAGEIATFIRLGGCNLNCSWCDTGYSIEKNIMGEQMTAREIHEYIKDNGATNVTITGGEPLIQTGISDLLVLLSKDPELAIHIETNGSVSIKEFKDKLFTEKCGKTNISFILDFKLPHSNMEKHMNRENLNLVDKNDVYKFVVASKEDLEVAQEIIVKYNLVNRTLVYLSPVLGKIELQDIVEFMKEHKMNKVRLQVQLHKIIWSPDMRGV